MNFNDYVWVFLTPDAEGILLYKYRRYQMPEYRTLEDVRSLHDFNGSYRFQLWDLMHTFGHYTFNGSQVNCFSPNEVFFSRPGEGEIVEGEIVE